MKKQNKKNCMYSLQIDNRTMIVIDLNKIIAIGNVQKVYGMEGFNKAFSFTVFCSGFKIDSVISKNNLNLEAAEENELKYRIERRRIELLQAWSEIVNS